MNISDIGAQRLTEREGVRLKPYNDSVGHCTVGIGHLIHKGRCTPEDIAKWTLPNQQAAIDLFRRDLAASYEPAVNAAVKVPLTQNQYDALVSFTYNVGVNGFRGSTLLKRLNSGDYRGAAEAFMMWNKPKEIIRRRQSEQHQFLTPYPNQPVVSTSPPQPAPRVELQRGPSSRFGKADWLHPVFRQRLEGLWDTVPFTVTSGGRSSHRQAELYRAFKAGRGNPANPPGTSWHEYTPDGSMLAQAADIEPGKGHTDAQLHRAAGRFYLHFPIRKEPWHIQPIEARSSRRTAGQGLGPVSAAPQQSQEDEVLRIIRTMDASGNVLPQVYVETNFSFVKWIPNGPVWDEIKRHAAIGVDEPVVILRSEFDTLQKVGSGDWPA